MEFLELLDRAKARLRLNSDRALGRALATDSTMISDYRRGVLPRDDVMLRLCGVCDVRPEVGLAYLNMWRSKGQARTAYRRIVKILEGEKTAA